MKLKIALFAVISLFFAAGCGGNSPKSVALKWHKAIIAGDLKAANAVSTDKTTAANAMIIGCLQDKENEEVKKFLALKYDTESINGDKAVVSPSAGAEDNEKIKLVKQNGKWLVDVDKEYVE